MQRGSPGRPQERALPMGCPRSASPPCAWRSRETRFMRTAECDRRPAQAARWPVARNRLAARRSPRLALNRSGVERRSRAARPWCVSRLEHSCWRSSKITPQAAHIVRETGRGARVRAPLRADAVHVIAENYRVVFVRSAVGRTSPHTNPPLTLHGTKVRQPRTGLPYASRAPTMDLGEVFCRGDTQARALHAMWRPLTPGGAGSEAGLGGARGSHASLLEMDTSCPL